MINTHIIRKISGVRIMAAAVLLTAAALLLGGCSAVKKSPVGRSKTADSIRASLAERRNEPAKTEAGEENTALSAGLGNRNRSAGVEESVSGNTTKDGDPEGTKLTLWTFNEAHVAYYRKLLKKWNDEDPDYTLEITFRVMPYEELHESLLEALRSGKGAPDICDIDAYRFADVSEGKSEWLYPVDVAVAPYIYDMHPARIDVYKAGDNRRYAVPFRMGAAVQYWNMELMEEAGITQKEVDAVKTWEDYRALGEKFKASAGSGKYFAAVKADDPVWPMLALAEYSGTPENAGHAADDMKAACQGWISSGIAKESGDMVSDIASGNIASFTGSLAFMDTFVQEIHDQYGKWYITKCPVFEDGQPCSVCLDDIPTVISAKSRYAGLAADFICYAKMYNDNARAVIWPELSYDVCNRVLWENEEFAHDETNEYDTFFRNYPYDVLNEIKDRIATVKP